MSIVDKICGKIGLGDPVEEQNEGRKILWNMMMSSVKTTLPGNIVRFSCGICQ